MMIERNIYCDESCHLENDSIPSMSLGALACAKDDVRETAVRLREIKEEHGLSPKLELKWNKVSKGKLSYYLDVVNYFFDNSNLSFRGLVVKDKGQLRHGDFEQDHDLWYYKIYYYLLQTMVSPEYTHNIYLDIKDTLGVAKVSKLHRILENSRHESPSSMINKIQLIRSDESELLQLADFFAGALTYKTRNLESSEAKKTLIERIIKRSNYSLTKSTYLTEKKFNLFFWEAR